MATVDERVEIAELRVEVAIALVAVICREVPDAPDRRLIIADVVDRWRALTDREREYFHRDGSRLSALAWFTAAYVEAVEDEEQVDLPADYDAYQLVIWRRHLQRLRSRTGWRPAIR